MKDNIKKLINTIFPDLSPEVWHEMDVSNIKNIFNLSSIICLVETVMLVVYLIINFKSIVSNPSLIYGALFCVIVSLIVAFTSRWIIKTQRYNHIFLNIFLGAYAVIMIAWAIYISYRNYCEGEHLLTFSALILSFISFFSFPPVIGGSLLVASYTALYLMAWFVDRAASFNVYSFVVLVIISVVGIISRFRYQSSLSSKNCELTFNSRHDQLTGMLNRTAFNEDLSAYLDCEITVIMSDIDYFKQLNDSKGHLVGDKVIREVGKFIENCFSAGCAYRYGGDEFLIIIREADSEMNDKAIYKKQSINVPVNGGRLFTNISFGVASGTPKNITDLMRLVSQADKNLYAVKKEIHKNDD